MRASHLPLGIQITSSPFGTISQCKSVTDNQRPDKDTQRQDTDNQRQDKDNQRQNKDNQQQKTNTQRTEAQRQNTDSKRHKKNDTAAATKSSVDVSFIKTESSFNAAPASYGPADNCPTEQRWTGTASVDDQQNVAERDRWSDGEIEDPVTWDSMTDRPTMRPAGRSLPYRDSQDNLVIGSYSPSNNMAVSMSLSPVDNDHLEGVIAEVDEEEMSGGRTPPRLSTDHDNPTEEEEKTNTTIELLDNILNNNNDQQRTASL